MNLIYTCLIVLALLLVMFLISNSLFSKNNSSNSRFNHYSTNKLNNSGVKNNNALKESYYVENVRGYY